MDQNNTERPPAEKRTYARPDNWERDEGPSEADIARAERVALGEQASSTRGIKLWQWAAVGIGIALFALLALEALPALLGNRGLASPVLMEATVTDVLDARTIEVDAGGKKQAVRLIGVGLFDRDDTLWWAARDAVQQAVSGRRVGLEKDTRDKDEEGLLLRYVFVDGVMLNSALLGAGLARSEDPLENVRRWQDLLQAEADARAAGRGVWSRPRLHKGADRWRAGQNRKGNRV